MYKKNNNNHILYLEENVKHQICMQFWISLQKESLMKHNPPHASPVVRNRKIGGHELSEYME